MGTCINMIIYLVVTPYNKNKFSTVEFLTEVLVLNGLCRKSFWMLTKHTDVMLAKASVVKGTSH